MQKKVADVCLRVVEEIDRLNRTSAKAKFTGIAELKKMLKIIAQSTSNVYKYRPGVLFNILDLKIGSMYSGTECIQAMLQLNKKRIVQGRLDAERLLLQLGSLDNKDVLNLSMGVELFVQVFNEAKERLSRELLSPNDSAALIPLKQLKLLCAMLC